MTKIKFEGERLEALIAAYNDDDNTGGCLCCGAIVKDTEPLVKNARCDECGRHCVMGAERILMGD